MSDQRAYEPDLIHQFKNHLGVIVGFCDVLLAEMPEDDARHADLLEMHKAAHAAMALVPELAKRMR